MFVADSCLHQCQLRSSRCKVTWVQAWARAHLVAPCHTIKLNVCGHYPFFNYFISIDVGSFPSKSPSHNSVTKRYSSLKHNSQDVRAQHLVLFFANSGCLWCLRTRVPFIKTNNNFVRLRVLDPEPLAQVRQMAPLQRRFTYEQPNQVYLGSCSIHVSTLERATKPEQRSAKERNYSLILHAKS